MKDIDKIRNRKYFCEYCCFGTDRKQSFESHLSTMKHIRIEVNHHDSIKNFTCDKCNKPFQTKSGLWKHSKSCKYESGAIAVSVNAIQTIPTTSIQIIDGSSSTSPSTSISNNNNVMQPSPEYINQILQENSEYRQLIIQENKELKEQLMRKDNFIQELSKSSGHSQITNNNIINTNTNNVLNNVKFNLNVFLNETCKNAMNIDDFVNQLMIGTKELEDTGKLGFVEGVSKIFINGLKQTQINDRPIHCSDSKRETIYIKNNDKWDKEDIQRRPILTHAIKEIINKNMKEIPNWTKNHPNCMDSSSRENSKYLKIVSETFPGTTEEECNKNFNKIIKNVIRETVIDKSVNQNPIC